MFPSRALNSCVRTAAAPVLLVLALAPAAAARSYEVVADRASVRSGPSGTARVVGTLAKGDRVGVVGRMGDWIRVEDGSGRQGWAEAGDLVPSTAVASLAGTGPQLASAGAPAPSAPAPSAPASPASLPAIPTAGTTGLAPLPGAPAPSPPPASPGSASPGAASPGSASPGSASQPATPQPSPAPSGASSGSSGVGNLLATAGGALVGSLLANALNGGGRGNAASPSSGSGASPASPAAADGPTHRVTASLLNVRTGPGTQYQVVRQLGNGVQVRVTGQQGAWRQLDDGSWVHGDYLAPIGGAGSSPAAGTGDPTANTQDLPSSSVGFVQLPTSGADHYGYYAASKRWGTPRLVYGIMRVARRFRAENPGAPRLGVGDLSLQNGGDITGHASHETGVDADLRPVRSDGAESPVTIDQGAYSRSLTERALRLFTAELNVSHIFFNDQSLIQAIGPVQQWPNHANHFHVRAR